METGDADDFLTNLDRVVNELENNDRVKRKLALKNFIALVFLKSENKCNILKAYSKGLKFIYISLKDSSEINRLLACDIIINFLESDIFTCEELIYLIPTLENCLISTPTEQSEDVRFKLLLILENLCIKFNETLIVYLNNVTSILKECILDKCPDNQRKACDIVCIFAKSTNTKFHMQSQTLVIPLLTALVHQRQKNRIAAMKAFESILIYGDTKAINEISAPLAQRFLDIAQVRQAVITLGGKLALFMPDRYSYWRRILPLLLTGLNDDDNENQCIAKDLWEKVGKQYEMENDEQVKEEEFDILVDFPQKRPIIGCRMLVQKNIYYILPGLINDLNDWQIGPRIQSAKLLSTLILHSECAITQYLESVVKVLFHSCLDEEDEVKKNIYCSAEYLGYFVKPSTYLSFVIPYFTFGSCKDNYAAVFYYMLKGSPEKDLQEKIVEIFNMFMQPEVLFNVSEIYQEHILNCVELLSTKCNLCEVSYEMFFVLLFLIASSRVSSIVNCARKRLEIFALISDCETVENFINSHVPRALVFLEKSAGEWQTSSPEFIIFTGILELHGLSCSHHIHLIKNILLKCVPCSHDPPLALHCLMKFQLFIQHYKVDLLNSDCLPSLSDILAGCILPLLSWQSGKTAEALRTAAASCFYAVCKFINQDFLTKEMASCMELLPSLLEDSSSDTRRISCMTVQVLAYNTKVFSKEFAKKLILILVQRLDDVSADVRLLSAQTLPTVFSCANFEDNSSWLFEAITDVLIYLDDPDPAFRKEVLGSLKQMGEKCSSELIDKVEAEKHKFRHKEHCSELQIHLKNLKL